MPRGLKSQVLILNETIEALYPKEQTGNLWTCAKTAFRRDDVIKRGLVKNQMVENQIALKMGMIMLKDCSLQ